LVYRRQEWTVLDASLWERVSAIAKVLTFGLGAATRTLWVIFIPLTLALLVWTVWNVVRGIRLERDLSRIRVLGILVFLATGLSYAAALAWARAAVVRDVYNLWPTRYMLLIPPLFYAVYVARDICGPGQQRVIVQRSLFASSLLLIPLNTAHGLQSPQWLSEHWRAMFSDLNCTIPEFADRHHRVLAHMVSSQDLVASTRMLRAAGRRRFTELRDAPVPFRQASVQQEQRSIQTPLTTVHYILDGATDAILVWGINGWHPVPGGLPQGTYLEDGTMRTPMFGSNGIFGVTLPVPADATIEFGFLSRDRLRNPALPTIWEGVKEPKKAPVRIPLKWGTNSGEVGQRRSEATLVRLMISEVPHMRQDICRW
jgi:hypothetical protein